jgi:GNAT superfamily N-acetyltransferase
LTTPPSSTVIVRNTERGDFRGLIDLCLRVYPQTIPWRHEQLESHLRLFPEGQFVAVDSESGAILGMAASLIIRWRAYRIRGSWRDFTDHGMFTNHDPRGRTLYGAEVMVSPDAQRRGVGSRLYDARRDLVRRLGLLRIRAASRLRGYHRHADQMKARDYVLAVVQGRIHDPTLSFQLKHGFEVILVIGDYLLNDPESLGYAAVIEWLNPEVAKPQDYHARNPRFLRMP